MTRILAAAGALAAVLIVGLGAVSMVRGPADSGPAPQPTKAAATEGSGESADDTAIRLQREELHRQVEEQADHKAAIDEQLTRAVREEAERLADEQS